MKRKLLLFYFVFIILFLSCSKSLSSEDYLKRLEKETNVNNLSSSEILFFYSNISGLDSSGTMYFVLQYDDLPNELFSQFISKGDSITNYEKKEYAKIGYSKDVDFENKINNIISSFKADYDNFKEEYKIDWNKKYIFITNYDYFRTYPIIYFEESKKAFYIVSKL